MKALDLQEDDAADLRIKAESIMKVKINSDKIPRNRERRRSHEENSPLGELRKKLSGGTGRRNSFTHQIPTVLNSGANMGSTLELIEEELNGSKQEKERRSQSFGNYSYRHQTDRHIAVKVSRLDSSRADNVEEEASSEESEEEEDEESFEEESENEDSVISGRSEDD